MKDSDSMFMKILIGTFLFMCGPFGLIIYCLGKRSNKE